MSEPVLDGKWQHLTEAEVNAEVDQFLAELREEKEVIPETMDMVNSPPHYRAGGKLEVIDALEGMGLTDCMYLGNAVKYIARSRHKGNEIQDLEKSIWWLRRKIQKLQEKSISHGEGQ